MGSRWGGVGGRRRGCMGSVEVGGGEGAWGRSRWEEERVHGVELGWVGGGEGAWGRSRWEEERVHGVELGGWGPLVCREWQDNMQLSPTLLVVGDWF
ncbi:hypothetical protein Pmani_038175 [Petrolisthes manimaculis]|uniref:Uncharacterized protein n=1 Tax=Petrolisthes manimaculis TaxID=1843537 RepID=A0AAE1NFD4_9EUCA|nr:hypothetical protein Pmani_038175 [Petrolisthes manimaculis]